MVNMGSRRRILLLCLVAVAVAVASAAETKRIHIRRRRPNQQAAESRSQSQRRRAPVVSESASSSVEELLSQAASQRRLNVAHDQENAVSSRTRSSSTRGRARAGASTASASASTDTASASASTDTDTASASTSTGRGRGRGRGGGRGRGRGGVSRTSSAQVVLDKTQQEAATSIVKPSLKPHSSVPSLPVATSDRKIVCYFVNWAQYRSSIGKHLPEHVDPFLCTHIVFAFSSLKHNKLSPFEHNDLTKDGKTGLYEQVTNLKKVNPQLKVLLAIGGWSFGTKKFKEMSSNRYNRRTFVYSVAPYLREHSFDGLDLDWEYPKGSTDKANFAELVKDLADAFAQEAKEGGRERLLLTAAVPVGPDTIRGGYDVPKLAKYLDIFNIMAYDFHGKWEKQAGHNAPLDAPSSDSEWRKQLSVRNAVNMWIRLGAPKHKIVVGMPTYGRSFTLSNRQNSKVNAPTSGGGTAGKYTKEGGFLAYYELCEMMYAGAQYIWDDEMSVPYLVQGDQWVGFDDERAIRIKMDFIKELGLAGAMVWSTDMDDFTATACRGAKYPLITAIREELLGIPREDKKKDIDWTKIAPSRPAAAPAAISPLITQLSTADILALLKAQGITPDANTIQKLGQVQLSSARAVGGSGNAIADPYNDNLSAPKVFCYVSSWARDRPGRGRFTPGDLDPTLCTHVVWAFAKIINGGVELPSRDQDQRDEDSDYQQLLRLREANPKLKLLVALGGWSAGPEPFQDITSSDYKMNNFVYDTVDFIRKNQLDGIDIDWEYPSGSADRTAYSKLIREFKLAFEGEAASSKKPRLMLTAALPASVDAIFAGYDVPEISKHLDFLNIMSYDFHGTWDDVVGHNAPLYPLDTASRDEKKMSVDYVAREWVKEGAMPEKMLIGMPTYGRTFTLTDPAEYDIGAAVSGGGKPARFTREEGFASYYEVCDVLERENTTLIWDNEQSVPFAFNDNWWVGFDDERSITTKVEWLRDLGFGGVMVWAADLDDFRGSCGTGPFPLLNAMVDALDGYRVAYSYDGGASYSPAAKVDPNEVVCDNADGEVTFHRDALDCKHYYLCQGTVRHHMPCPSDLVFNEAQSVCDWPENVEECAAFTQAPPAA